jgi:hypothetical protein
LAQRVVFTGWFRRTIQILAGKSSVKIRETPKEKQPIGKSQPPLVLLISRLLPQRNSPERVTWIH